MQGADIVHLDLEPVRVHIDVQITLEETTLNIPDSLGPI